MTNKGLVRLADICLWDNAGNWVGYSFPEIPIHLLSQHKLLIYFLSVLAPVHCSSKDQWGWDRTRFYSAAQGFSILQTPYVSCLSPECWKSVWSPYSFAKENFFAWLLMHKRVLTGENLNKRGFNVPFQCCFCSLASETSDHLFIDC